MKVAISVPDPIFHQAEMLAATMHKSRSQLYAEALAGFVRAHSAREVTERLNAVHGRATSALDPGVSAAQLKVLARETW
jgi:hypothetical protein